MSFGTGPVLHRLRPGPTVGAKARLDRRDDADHALWSFFKNAALKAGAHMAMDKRLEEQAARSGLLSSSSLRKAAAARDRTALDNHRHGARIWQKAIPMVLAAMRNPLHHHSVVDAALNLLNSLIQPKCTTAIGACSVAVQAGLIPSLKKLLVTDMLMSSSTTVLEACAVLRRVASIPRHRATLTKVNNGIEQLLVDLIVKRPAPGVVDVALHCLQNMCVAATSAKRVLDTSPVGGVRAITMLLNDSVSVDGCAGVLANIACHGAIFRRRTAKTETLQALLSSISVGDGKVFAFAALQSARALKNLAFREEGVASECGMLNGVAVLESLRLRLSPIGQNKGSQEDRRQQQQQPPNGIMDATALTSHPDSQPIDVRCGRKRPAQPVWFDPLILRIRQSNRAPRRALLVANDFTQFSPVAGTDRHEWRNGFLPSTTATLAVLQNSLEQTGFEVAAVADASRRVLARAIDQFIDSLREGDVAVFSFVGYGTAVNGTSYLLPIDFPALGRLREAATLGTSIRWLAATIAEKVGPKGTCICTFEAPGVYSGEGQRFPTLSPLDCAHISKFNNVCLTFCTTRPVAAVDGSTFAPLGPREECAPLESQFFETTAFTYELCGAITDAEDPVEVTMMAKRLRQRLVQNMLDDFDTMDGRLPWCNSNCVDDFYFVASESQDAEDRERYRQKQKKKKQLLMVKKNKKKKEKENDMKKHAASSPVRTGRRAVPPPPSSRMRPRSTGKSPRRRPTPPNKNRANMQSPRHAASVTSDLGPYELTRESKFEGMEGTEMRVNLTNFVHDAMFLKASGTDVASSARWTSSLRGSPRQRTVALPSNRSAPSTPRIAVKMGKKKRETQGRRLQNSQDAGKTQLQQQQQQQTPYFYQQFMAAGDEEDEEQETSSTNEPAWKHLRQTTQAQLRQADNMEPSYAPALAFLDDTCEATGHDWSSTMDNLQCLRCGAQQAIDISQDVYRLDAGFVAKGLG
jgi:hypothetical protein